MGNGAQQRVRNEQGGATFGDMTGGEGRVAAFDGQTSETAATSAAVVDGGTIGKDWGEDFCHPFQIANDEKPKRLAERLAA
jgi:hypothetical protein